MPGAVAQTATIALSNSTLPFAKKIVGASIEEVLQNEPALYRGVNTYKGYLVHEAVAGDLGIEHTSLDSLL